MLVCYNEPVRIFEDVYKIAQRMLGKRMMLVYFSYGQGRIYPPAIITYDVHSAEYDAFSLVIRGPVDGISVGLPDGALENDDIVQKPERLKNEESVVISVKGDQRALIARDGFITGITDRFENFKTESVLDPEQYNAVQFIHGVLTFYDMFSDIERVIELAERSARL